MPVAYKDYYAVLDVPKTATEKEIRSAYRKLAKKWHPDANRDNQQAAEEKFKELQEAYEVLGDPEKRRKYDALGSDWQEASAQANQQRRHEYGDVFSTGDGFSDFFETFFSGVGRRTSATGAMPRRGEDIEANIALTLGDAYSGGTKNISMEVEDRCPTCGGTGIKQQRICPTCHGTGRVLSTKSLEVRIPKGVRDGQRIRLVGQGGNGINGGPPGDLYLVVHIEPDPRFERDGDDLHTDLSVPLYDLILGGEVTVPTLTGEVTMKIPPGTQNEQLMRLTGKGMPRLNSNGYGNEYVRVSAQLPKHLTERQRELFKELAASER